MSDVMLFADREPFAVKEHLAIIQSLGRTATSTDPDGNKHDVYLTPEAFEATLDAWEGKPVFFAEEHPNIDAYETDPDAELKRIKGRKIGNIKKPRVDKVGHPKLMAEVAILDAEVEALLATGKLGLSTGFKADTKDGKIAGNIRPHHLLVFGEMNGAVPGDKGTWFLNQDKDYGFSELDADKLAAEWDALAKEYEKL